MSLGETDFYKLGGTLERDAPSYVERTADRNIVDVLSSGEYCYVLTSRQMGKSSLMTRAAARLREKGIRVASVDLTGLGSELDQEQWYFGILESIAEALELEDDVGDFWDAHRHLSPLQRFSGAVR